MLLGAVAACAQPTVITRIVPETHIRRSFVPCLAPDDQPPQPPCFVDNDWDITRCDPEGTDRTVCDQATDEDRELCRLRATAVHNIRLMGWIELRLDPCHKL
jgi:hypothetical protein